MNHNLIDYQPGFLTGYSGGHTVLEVREVFNLLYISYPTGCVWQNAIALSTFQHLN